jgi:hypothetical protein
MNIPAHPTLINSMCQSRVSKLKAACPVLAASLVVIEKTCGHPGCRCQRGEKHAGHYLTFKEAGKTRTVYVPVDLLEDVQEWVQEHQRLKQLSAEISQLAIALIRSHVTMRRKRAGRS